MARRRWMGERQPDMKRHQAGLGAGADEGKDQRQRRKPCRRMRSANLREGVVPFGSG